MNGVYGIVQDYNPSKKVASIWVWSLWGLGLILFALGLSLLPRFVAFAAGT